MALLDILQQIKTENKSWFKAYFRETEKLKKQLQDKGVLDKDEYKQEVDLLLKATDSGYFEKISRMTLGSNEMQTVIRDAIGDFKKAHGASTEDAVRIISYFATLLDCKMPEEYLQSSALATSTSINTTRETSGVLDTTPVFKDLAAATGKQPTPLELVVQASTLPVPQQEPTQDSKLEGRLDKLEVRIEDYVKELRAMQSQRPQIETSPQAQDLSKNSVIAELREKVQVLSSNLETQKKTLIDAVLSLRNKDKDLEAKLDAETRDNHQAKVNFDARIKELEGAISKLNNANSQASTLAQAQMQASLQSNSQIQILVRQLAQAQLLASLQGDSQIQILVQELAQTRLQDNISKLHNEISQYKTNIERQLSPISKYLQDVNLQGITITNNQDELSDRLKALEEQQTRNNGSQDLAKLSNLVREQQTQLERLERRLDSIQNTNKPASTTSSISEPPVTSKYEPAVMKPASKSIATSKPESKPVNTQIIRVFNQWAKNPSGKLPVELYYIENAMTIRTECELASSPSETKWIANRMAPLYLFPNPNTFTPQTDISEFYELDMSRLKPKGQNRINITEPCEMTERGYVSYPGKLEMLH